MTWLVTSMLKCYAQISCFWADPHWCDINLYIRSSKQTSVMLLRYENNKFCQSIIKFQDICALSIIWPLTHNSLYKTTYQKENLSFQLQYRAAYYQHMNDVVNQRVEWCQTQYRIVSCISDWSIFNSFRSIDAKHQLPISISQI